tara:strand:+ start:1600 stop:2400 length:801 start_codon:yes stop_codon:yes gene_type:complete
MSSFLDKLLSPSVRRDIGAMGVRSSEEFGNIENETKEWYEGFDNLTPWDDLNEETRKGLAKFFTGDLDLSSAEASGISETIGLNAQAFTEGVTTDTGVFVPASELIATMGFGTASNTLSSQYTSPESFGGIGFNPLSRESILENLPGVGEKYREDAYEGNTQNLLESVKPLTMEQIRKTTTGFYNPYIEKEKKPLVDRLIDKRKTATALGGDFAGYGQREQYQDIAEGSFMSGVENIYSDVDAERASALDDLYGTIASWQDVGAID